MGALTKLCNFAPIYDTGTMLKDLASRFLRTSFFVVAVLTLHILLGSAASSIADQESASIETTAHSQAALFADSSNGIDDFGLTSGGCSLPHTSLARPSSFRTSAPNSIAKHVLANWNLLSKTINRLFFTAERHSIYTGVNYTFSCEYYIFALRKLLI